MTDMTEAQVFEGAIAVLHERGWHQGSLWNRETGAVCTLGALQTAAVDPLDWVEASLRLDRHIGAPVDEWNDAPSRTVEDVFLALKQCAEDARAEAVAS